MKSEITYKFYDIQQLARCMSDAAIEASLADLEVADDPGVRTAYLHEFMGTTHRYSLNGNVGDLDTNQEYKLAKLQLLAINSED